MERGTQLRQHNNQLVVVIYPELYYYSSHFYVYIIKLLQLKHSVVVLRELKITSYAKRIHLFQRRVRA